MGTVKNIGSKVVEYLDDLATGSNFNRMMNANNGINGFSALHKVGSSLASPFEVISRYAYEGKQLGMKDYGVTDALARTFLKDTSDYATRKGYNWSLGNISKGKAFGAYAGASLTASVVGGLTHDSAGNPDIAGLPGI